MTATPTARTDPRTGWADGLAKLVTEVLAPQILVAGLLAAVAWHAAESWVQAVTTGLIAAAAASALPMAYILHGVRRRRLSDKHVTDHSQRRMPLLVILASTVAGTAALVLAGAPRELVALIATMLAALLVVVPITIRAGWGISLHALVAAGTAGALTVAWGPALVASWLIVPVVCWARVRIRQHTVGQVVAGALVGAIATGVLFPILAG